MAGDWIKMRTDLRDDPAVISMTTTLGLDPDTVVGKLHRLWSWATDQLRDGNARGVTETWVDAHVCVTGFARAMSEAGWLTIKSGCISFPNWDSHLSKGAKNRANTKDRVAKYRNAASVTTPLPEKRREEKRREEENPQPPTGVACVSLPGFDSFWAAWPPHHRKSNKAACRKRWESAGCEGERLRILAALDAWKVSADWNRDGGRYVPAPAVWLNQRRWEAPHPPIAQAGDKRHATTVDEVIAQSFGGFGNGQNDAGGDGDGDSVSGFALPPVENHARTGVSVVGSAAAVRRACSTPGDSGTPPDPPW